MRFIPGLGHDFLTPAYDVLARLGFPEFRFKRRLIAAAAIAPHHRVLDVGCGTGTLLLLASRERPDAMFAGIDPDPRMLRRARKKVPAATFEEGSAVALPFADATFDRVFSTLAFHHLTQQEKRAAMKEILRVLTPGGEFHLGDFGQPDSTMTRIASAIVQRIGHEHVEENYRGALPRMLEESGFANVHETARFTTIFGVLRSIGATKP